LVTGFDLVKEQIRIAAGKKLSFSQRDISWKGSAIECRIYAEDVHNNFLPYVGTITTYREPGGPGVRVDSGLSEGDEVQIYYDPLISKLITWGTSRDEAIKKMKRALQEYKIAGVKTGIPVHQLLLDNPEFKKGNISTHFIEDEFLPSLSKSSDGLSSHEEAIAVFSALIDFSSKLNIITARQPGEMSGHTWKHSGRRRNVQK
jgi:acetyl/propionyl-CoA carboxylase alpha subunit